MYSQTFGVSKGNTFFPFLIFSLIDVEEISTTGASIKWIFEWFLNTDFQL